MQPLFTASQQLDDACDLYCRRRYVGALTVAGAAEEVLGDILRGRRKKGVSLLKSALGERVSTIARLKGTNPEKKSEKDVIIEFLNHARNVAKHLRTRRTSRSGFVWKDEAKDMIERAVLNFRRVTGDFPDSESFYQFRAAK